MTYSKLPLVHCLATSALFLLAGCGTDSSAHDAVHWSYTGDGEPAHWGDLSPEYAVAKEGKRQSPIDLTGAQAATEPGELEFVYVPGSLNLVNNGHTIQQNCDAGSVLKVGEASYDLLQFHFHSASEHTVDGHRFALEMHLVHANEAGELAVVGVLFDEGDSNEFLAGFFGELPAKEGATTVNPATSLNPIDVLPEDRSHFVYDGSLTTPPCSEGVHWFVMSNAVSISSGQLAQFHELYEGNFRPVQPLNGRDLLRTGK